MRKSFWRCYVFSNLPPEIAGHFLQEFPASRRLGSFHFVDNFALLVTDSRQVKPSVANRSDQNVGKLRGGDSRQGLFHARISGHPPQRSVELKIAPRASTELRGSATSLHPL